MAKNSSFQKSKHFLPFDLEICISFETDKIATHPLVKRHSVPMEKRVSDMQRLLPHVWGDHTYKSPYGHAYIKTHKYCKLGFTAV